ncbi:unnamed protein product [Toxocara canis]|uniref:BRCT domain-containing protein n=1 Tax=Toxocara canis TaxID=6265 RepID=A0A183UZU9_TOXCA|nr:unnamed protein product [Toxocara canis]
MTNYWISESRELEKTATKVPKGKESRVKKGNAVHNERKPNTDEFSYDSKMKSIIAHLISADEYSLIIEREGDSSPYETDIHFGHLCIEEDSNDDNRKPLSTETSDAMKETKENRPELENCGNRFESPEIAATVDEHFVQSESKSTQQAVGRIANSNRVKTPHKLATPDWSFVPHSEHLGSLGEKLNFVQPQNLKRKRRKALIPVTHSPIEDSKGAIHSSIPESEAFLNEEIDRAGPAAPPSLEFGIGNQRPYEPVEKHDVSKTNHGRNYLFADKKLSNSPAVKFTRYSSVQSRRLADSGVIEQNNGPASPLRKAYCAEGDSLGNIVKLNSEVLYSTPGTDCNRNPVSISGNTYDRKSASIEIVESRSEVHKEDAYEEDMPGGLRTMDGCISFEGITEPPSSGQGKNELASSDAASERNQSKNARNLRSKIMDDPTSKPLPTLQEDFKSDTSNRFSASFPDFLNKSTEMGQTSMDTAFDQFRRCKICTNSGNFQPGIFISSPFGSSQNRSPLAPIQPSPNLSFVNEAGERKSEAEKSSIVERPDQEETLWRSQSIHNDMAICSSGYWGIVKQKRQTLGREEHIVGKQDTSRNLSIREEDPNRMPFFLVGFPWTKSYAKKRDFKKEMIFLCGQKAVLKWGALKEIL